MKGLVSTIDDRPQGILQRVLLKCLLKCLDKQKQPPYTPAHRKQCFIKNMVRYIPPLNIDATLLDQVSGRLEDTLKSSKA